MVTYTCVHTRVCVCVSVSVVVTRVSPTRIKSKSSCGTRVSGGLETLFRDDEDEPQLRRW